jgi:hypothetical protein
MDTKVTPKKQAQERFLAAYQESCIVAEAAKASGVTRKTLYRWKESDPEFAARWAEVKRWVIDNLEGIAYKRASEGSDTLVIFLLKSLRPSVYRESLNVKHGGKVGVAVEIEEGVDEAIDGLLAENDRLTQRLAELEGAKT